MAKKDVSKSITKVKPDVSIVPDFMKDERDLGLEALKRYIVPPRIKVVQKQASDELLKDFSAGDVILSPLNATVVEQKRDNKGRILEGTTASFKFVPIFFYAEWATCNPIELRGSEPFIAYRTVDPTDPIVQKARNTKLRKEKHPNEPSLEIRHVEFLNYVVVLYENALTAEPAILSFSKGEHGSGSKFAGLITMRRAAIYGCVFEAAVSLRHGQLGDWYGLDVSNPQSGSPWVTKEEYEKFKELHLEFAKHHKEARLRARLEPDDVEPDEAATPGNDEF